MMSESEIMVDRTRSSKSQCPIPKQISTLKIQNKQLIAFRNNRRENERQFAYLVLTLPMAGCSVRCPQRRSCSVRCPQRSYGRKSLSAEDSGRYSTQEDA